MGIGTSSPAFKLDVIGASTPTLRVDDGAASGTRIAGRLLLGNNATLGVAIENSVSSFNDNCSMVFKTTPPVGTITERARIDSSGNLLVGTTDGSTGNKIVTTNTLGFVSGAVTPQINFYSSNGFIELVNRDASSAKEFRFYYGASASAFAFLTTTGVWTNASDLRGKENIEEIHYGLETVMALQPRQFKVKSANRNAIGFVAQEVLPVIPEIVHGKEEDQYGLDYGSITAVLVKAIQDQQAIIEALEARITALEA